MNDLPLDGITGVHAGSACTLLLAWFPSLAFAPRALDGGSAA